MNWLSTSYSIGAKEFLARRLRERRPVPFIPIQVFGLEKMTAPVDWTEAVKSAGADNAELET